MAQFTKQVIKEVKFTAYQFDPKALKGLHDYDIEDVIIEALEIDDNIKSAFIDPQGKLIITLYTYGKESTKETFDLSPGEWLTDKGTADYDVLSDEEFREFIGTM